MANRAELVWHDMPVAGGVERDDIKTEFLAEASYMIPSLWFSVFEAGDLQETQEILDDDVDPEEEPESFLCPVRDVAGAQRLLDARSNRIRQAFAAHINIIDAWTAFIQGLDDGYLTLELTEMVMFFGSEDLTNFMKTGMRWFETGSSEDFKGLQELAPFDYDAEIGMIFDVRDVENLPQPVMPKRPWYWPFGKVKPPLPPRNREKIWASTFLAGYGYGPEVPWKGME